MGIIVGAVVLVALGIVGLILLLRKKEEEECVPEAERLAAARAQVAIKETAVKKAREHLEYTLAHATEQAVQREVEARQRLAQTERELEEARDEERAAQHAYNVCMGLVPPTPEPEPEPEVTPPVAPPPRPEMPGPPPDAPTSVDESDTGRPGVSETTDQVTTTPPPPPPPPRKADCVDGQSREIEESKQSFTIPADGMVRLSIATEDGPLDDLEDAVSVTPIADMITEQIAELLAPDSLGVTAEALTPQSARSWQSAFEKMAATARTEVEVVIEYDLETVTLVCIRLEECVKGSWVTVGHRLEERSREKETVSARWETVGSGRPLGATFTVIKRELDKAAAAKGDMDRFSSACN